MTTIEPIGIIHSPHTDKAGCPIQPTYATTSLGKVEILEQYQEGLKDIEAFSHLYLLYYFDRAGVIKLIRPTFLDDHPHGIYASRHPCRPNGIGLSIVRLIKRDHNILEVAGVDMLDGTPLLDIKPYIPRFDSVPDATEGWLTGREWRPKPRDKE